MAAATISLVKDLAYEMTRVKRGAGQHPVIRAE